MRRGVTRPERIARAGKSSLRRITKGNVSKKVSIRTTQDTWIAFPRNEKNDGWATLEDVDYVVAASVDNRDNPRFAQVHMFDGDEMRARFDRAYAARKAANHVIPERRGIWLSIYDREAAYPVSLVGAGAGLDHPPIAKEPLSSPNTGDLVPQTEGALDPQGVVPEEAPQAVRKALPTVRETPLTIRETNGVLLSEASIDQIVAELRSRGASMTLTFP
jgi:hypothetical protein